MSALWIPNICVHVWKDIMQIWALSKAKPVVTLGQCSYVQGKNLTEPKSNKITTTGFYTAAFFYSLPSRVSASKVGGWGFEPPWERD